mgnify:CR=1 FL=1
MIIAFTTPAILLARRGRGGQGPATAKAAAPVDLTGYWVSVVTEDWRYRMVTPKRATIPASRSTPKASAWPIPGIRRKTKRRASHARRNGAAGVMRAPGRIHITWQDDNALKVETEAGTQTRIVRFAASHLNRQLAFVAG